MTFRHASAALGQKPLAFDGEAPVHTRVTPSLHPENIRQIEGFNDSTAHYLAPAETAFSTAYEGLGAIWRARDAANKNTGWNEDQRIVQVSAFAQKQFEKIAKTFDKTRDELMKNIAAVEKELTAPVVNAGNAFQSVEIRAHFKGLTESQRHMAIRAAIEGGDHTTMGALLGAPAYLTGLNAEFHGLYLRSYREVMAPQLAQRLKAMVGARDLIDQRSVLVWKEMEKAVGVSTAKAVSLKKAQDAALAALEVK